MAIGNIEEFKARLINGGARPTLFYVSCAFPNLNNSSAAGKEDLTNMAYMCKAASIPESVINAIPVGYQGRTVKLAGDRSYNNWAVSIINTEDFAIRNAFENWHFQLNLPVDNIRVPNMVPLLNYKTDVIVTQLGQGGEEIRSYRMVGAFPLQIGAIDLSWDNLNTIEEFPVTFAYDYWEPLID